MSRREVDEVVHWVAMSCQVRRELCAFRCANDRDGSGVFDGVFGVLNDFAELFKWHLGKRRFLVLLSKEVESQDFKALFAKSFRLFVCG